MLGLQFPYQYVFVLYTKDDARYKCDLETMNLIEQNWHGIDHFAY